MFLKLLCGLVIIVFPCACTPSKSTLFSTMGVSIFIFMFSQENLLVLLPRQREAQKCECITGNFSHFKGAVVISKLCCTLQEAEVRAQLSRAAAAQPLLGLNMLCALASPFSLLSFSQNQNKGQTGLIKLNGT